MRFGDPVPLVNDTVLVLDFANNPRYKLRGIRVSQPFTELDHR